MIIILQVWSAAGPSAAAVPTAGPSAAAVPQAFIQPEPCNQDINNDQLIKQLFATCIEIPCIDNGLRTYI